MHSGLIYSGIFFGSILFLITSIRLLLKRWRKKEAAKWKVGDKVVLHACSCRNSLKEKGKDYADLLGWDDKHIYVSDGEYTYKEERSKLDFNKSSSWRENYNSCKDYMGVNPKFSGSISDKTETIDGEIDGIRIELMNETQCQVYLKKAIEEENYEAAEKIRNRMEAFR